MNTKTCLILIASICAVIGLRASDFTYRTFVVPGFGPNLTNALFVPIASYETFEMTKTGYGWTAHLFKDQNPFVVTDGEIFTGPGVLRLTSSEIADKRLVTIKVYTQFQPPDKTVVIPPGQGGVVTLQMSSNLVDWVTTTNGLHTNVPSMKFFRVNIDRVP